MSQDKINKGVSVVSNVERRMNITRWVVYSILLLLFFLMQTTPGLFPIINGAHANLLVPLIVCIGMHEEDIVGAYFGLAAGVMWDTVANHVPGYHSIVLMLVGCMCGLLITHLMRNNFLTALFLSFSAIFIHSLFYWIFFYIFPGQEEYFTYFVKYSAPSMVYTFLLTPLIYLLIRILSSKIRMKI